MLNTVIRPPHPIYTPKGGSEYNNTTVLNTVIRPPYLHTPSHRRISESSENPILSSATSALLCASHSCFHSRFHTACSPHTPSLSLTGYTCQYMFLYIFLRCCTCHFGGGQEFLFNIVNSTPPSGAPGSHGQNASLHSFHPIIL